MTALSSLAGVSPQFIKQALSKAAALRQKFFFDSFFFQEKRMTASYIFSGASTPSRARPFFSTLRAASASLSRAFRSCASSPLMRQAV